MPGPVRSGQSQGFANPCSGIGEFTQLVELALKVALKGLACCNDLLHDLVPLLLGNGWAKWVVSKVPADADSSRHDHGGFIFWEWWGLELGDSHI